jgi:hypothetical protein
MPKVLRTRADDLVRDRTYRIQIQAWIKMTEHLVRDGLGLKHYTTAAELIPHYKASIRLLLADGAKSKIPDRAHDTFDCNDGIDIGIKQLLESALHLQDFLHGMRGLGTYTLRFTPVGSTKRWGFAFDRAWMELDDVLDPGRAARRGAAGRPARQRPHAGRQRRRRPQLREGIHPVGSHARRGAVDLWRRGG